MKEKTAAFEGHSFIVEAGVSLGGLALKEGINIYRFANRIPLLFEVRRHTRMQRRRVRHSFLRCVGGERRGHFCSQQTGQVDQL
jgi:hypothetical protein